MEELSEIKKLRKKIGITQNELSKRSNVSQSLIAKIESGKIDPSYTNAKKIFETLYKLDSKDELTANDIMHNQLIYAKHSETVKEVIVKMKENDISQLPVLEGKKIIGFISESQLLNKLLEGNHSTHVSEIMEQAPPIIPPSTTQSVIGNLLKHFPLVLVEEKGEFLGIITKTDLLKAFYDGV